MKNSINKTTTVQSKQEKADEVSIISSFIPGKISEMNEDNTITNED
jgi:hypothetical protein